MPEARLDPVDQDRSRGAAVALRIVDVFLGTVRLVATVRGRRALAAGIRFVEVLVWVLAVGQALQHLGAVYHVVDYAGGFAAGTAVGLTVERLLITGPVDVLNSVVARQDTPDQDAVAPWRCVKSLFK